jgi:hypothetical protein
MEPYRSPGVMVGGVVAGTATGVVLQFMMRYSFRYAYDHGTRGVHVDVIVPLWRFPIWAWAWARATSW